MGNSNRAYFKWMLGALDRAGMWQTPFEDAWHLGATAQNIVTEQFDDRATGETLYYDIKPIGLASFLDFNDCTMLPPDAVDVVTMLRCSYFLTSASRFLRQAERVLRPGGRLCVDWIKQPARHGGETGEPPGFWPLIEIARESTRIRQPRTVYYAHYTLTILQRGA